MTRILRRRTWSTRLPRPWRAPLSPHVASPVIPRPHRSHVTVKVPVGLRRPVRHDKNRPVPAGGGGEHEPALEGLDGGRRGHVALERPLRAAGAAQQRPQPGVPVAAASPRKAPPVAAHRQAVDVRRRRGPDLRRVRSNRLTKEPI